MSNVYGSISTTSGLVDVFDPYAVTTDAVTLLSFTASETPQNQMRDLAKVIKKKIPVDTSNTELVFPFNSALFTTPLTYVAEASLPISLRLAVTKAVGVQWSFSRTKTISAGCAFVLGDTKQLEDEATADPKKSTFTVNHVFPSGTVAESTFQLTVYKYLPGLTQQRVFSWSSLDVPEVVCAKWKAVMEPYVTFGGTSGSFGHAVLTYDRTTGKYVGTFDPNTASWGTSTASDDSSKVNMGLNTSPTVNLFWNPTMGVRSFANVANPAYRRLGVVVDSTQRITVEVLATGSQRTNKRQIKFDITRYQDELNGLLSFFNPAIAYTMIFANSDIIYDIVFYAGSTQIAVNPEASSSIAFYSQIYKPVIRICGGVLVIATPAYNPAVINALNKVSPAFNNQTLINVDPNWPVTTGWRASQSSYYQSSAAFIGWKCFDRIDSTYWASAELAFSASGVGNQWVQMEYPEAVKMVSHKINPSTSLTTGTPLQWTLSGSNNNSSFVSVETFQFKSWQANKTETFVTTQPHVPYKYWRITITLIRTSGAAIHCVLYELSFNTGCPFEPYPDRTKPYHK
ncbi:hypothetical protein T492DRAFT_846157 [Pavlovales sp. CCMP2436]|nr:hypothetical protein T492DRAFT_846157 [Pavlovales sp. CCMP2436]